MKKSRFLLSAMLFLTSYSQVTDAALHKQFGDYTTYITTQPNGSVHKQANVRLEGMLAELTFFARSDSKLVYAFVNKQAVQLIVDGVTLDNTLTLEQVKLIKNARTMAVIHGDTTYQVSTKGSGASMIYLTDFPAAAPQQKQVVLAKKSTSAPTKKQLMNAAGEQLAVYMFGKMDCKATKNQAEYDKLIQRLVANDITEKEAWQSSGYTQTMQALTRKYGNSISNLRTVAMCQEVVSGNKLLIEADYEKEIKANQLAKKKKQQDALCRQAREQYNSEIERYRYAKKEWGLGVANDIHAHNLQGYVDVIKENCQ